MQDKEERNHQFDRYQVEEKFEDFEEYQAYLFKALAMFQDLKKKRSVSFASYVPEFLEIDFADIKAPRLYYPRYKGTLVIQFPVASLSPKKKGLVRAQKLLEFAGIVKINELAMADQFAIRMKLFDKRKKSKRFFKNREPKQQISS